MTNLTLTKNNFNGNWKIIPRYNGTNTQLILSKNMNNKNGKEVFVCYNFNYDIKDHVIGKQTSLMNELLGLDKNKFYKCIIGNESITFIIMNETEINDYKSSMKKDCNNNHENNNQDNNQDNNQNNNQDSNDYISTDSIICKIKQN